MKNQIQARKQGKSKSHHPQIKTATPAAMVPPEMADLVPWKKVLAPHALRIRKLDNVVGTCYGCEGLTRSALAAFVYFGEKNMQLPGMILNGMDEQNYSFILHQKFAGFEMNRLDARLIRLSNTLGWTVPRLINFALKCFLDYALVNRCEALDFICMVHDLLKRDEPLGESVVVRFALPKYIWDWAKVDHMGNSLEFLTDTIRAKVLQERGLPWPA